jgi:ketosteroid isomerase-like protein
MGDTAWAMSKENVEAWRRAIDAFNNRSVAGMQAECDPDVEFRPLVAGVREAPYQGEQGFREFLANTDEAFEFFRLDAKRIEDHDDFVLAVCEAHARGAASGAEIRRQLTHIAEFRDGLCIWWRTFQTRQEALEAAGLSE